MPTFLIATGAIGALMFSQVESCISGITFNATRCVFEGDTKSNPQEALTVYVDGAQSGEWFFEKESDAMNPISIVALVTPAEKLDNGKPSGRYGYFGIQFFGPNIASITTSADGRESWPNCDFDYSSISIDGGKARFIAETEGAGTCDRINLDGATIKQMKAGSKAIVRLNQRDYIISLQGFATGLLNARKMAR